MAAINDAQTRRELGRLGEELAVEYFRQHGMLVLDRNWRPQRGLTKQEVAVRSGHRLGIVMELLAAAEGRGLAREDREGLWTFGE